MPGTNFEFALKRCSVMVCIVVRVFSFVMIVNTDDRSGKSGDFTESYKDGFVNLALRSKQRPEVKQSDARKCQDGCDDKLYVTFVWHNLEPPRPRFKGGDVWGVGYWVWLLGVFFSFDGAKLQQKNEPTKKVGS